MASSLAEFTNDKLFSGQYTSFEMKSGELGSKVEAVGGASKPIPLAQFVQQPLKVGGVSGVDAGRKVPTVFKEMAIDNNQIVQFYGRNHWLSNFLLIRQCIFMGTPTRRWNTITKRVKSTGSSVQITRFG